MKNVFLFAILALSINAKAQNLHPTSDNHQVSSSPIAYVLEKMKDGVGKSTSHFPEKNFGESIKHQTTMLLPPLQIIDSIYTWQWDSDSLIMNWKFYLKEIDIVYDANHNVTSVTLQFWNDTTWQTLAKIDFSYDTNNNQTSVLYQGWIGGAWENLELETNTYDLNNNQTRYLDQNWNVNAWENRVQDFYTYDANNNETKIIHQFWNSSAWENSYQYLYTYNIQNNLTRGINQSWNGFAWENSYQYINTYDVEHNRTGELDQSWDSSTWVNTNNYIYTYDDNHNQTNDTYQTWDGSAWVNASKTIYTYDANNNLAGEVSQSWDGSSWVISSQYKYIYTFDANQNLTNELKQIWNDSVWVNSSESINTYFDNFLESNSIKYFDETGTVSVGDSTHYYFHTVTGIKDLAADDDTFNLYPNPTSGKFTIRSNSTLNAIEIYNLLGERIYSNSKINNETAIDIDLSTFGKGIYFGNMFDGTVMYIRKIVIQ